MFQFGIMGAGNIASQFCDAVKRSGCAEVAAVASRTPGKAKVFAEKNNIMRRMRKCLRGMISTECMWRQLIIFIMKT